MKTQINMKDASWRYSKLCGLRFLDWLSGLGAGRASRAMKELYLYVLQYDHDTISNQILKYY